MKDRWPGAVFLSRKVSNCTYLAADSGARNRRAAQREAGPGNRHRPGFDAAVSVKPLFEPNCSDQRVDVDGLLFLDHAIELDRPRARFQRAGVDTLARAELVKVVVVEVVFSPASSHDRA